MSSLSAAVVAEEQTIIPGEVIAYFNTLTPEDISPIKTYKLPNPLGEYISEISHQDSKVTVTIEGALCDVSEHELTYVCNGKCNFTLNPKFRCTMY